MALLCPARAELHLVDEEDDLGVDAIRSYRYILIDENGRHDIEIHKIYILMNTLHVKGNS